MSINKIRLSNGDILTGRLWRNGHSFFKDLPFYSSIPRMDEMAGPLEAALDDGRESSYKGVLVVSLFAIFCSSESNIFDRNLPRV
jgi:hypothetical protein